MTALLEWNDQYAIGIAAVDHEHQELIELINESLVALGDRKHHEIVLDAMAEINTRISSHFALEERIMREHKYDEYFDHKADHDRLLDDIRDMMDEFETDDSLDLRGFAERLHAWFSVHFRSKDARLHKTLGELVTH